MSRTACCSLLLLVLAAVLWGCGSSLDPASNPTSDPNPPGGGSGGDSGGDDGGSGGGSGGSSTAPELVTETVASGLTVPWEMVFASDGRMFFTEQPGRVRIISAEGKLLPPALDLTAEVPGGEAGMLGLVLDPGFANNHFLYVFYCTGPLESPTCRIARMVECDNRVTVDKVLFDFPGAKHHNAGRIKLGPDGLLHATIGDVHDSTQGQKLNIFGSVVRMKLDGSPAEGNPFPEQPYVYAWGFRDPQGLAFDSSGVLYGTEHGSTSNDEVNIIRRGENYGWAACIGICNDPRYTDPVRLFHPETAAPSGATFYYGSQIPQWDGSLLFATLGLDGNTFARHIHRIKFDGPGSGRIVEEEVLYRGEFGRIRNVVQGPDGYVYFSTSNGGGNDKIVRIRPKD